jgi:hypothetical protein
MRLVMHLFAIIGLLGMTANLVSKAVQSSNPLCTDFTVRTSGDGPEGCDGKLVIARASNK